MKHLRALELLGQQALAFAECYVRVVEALLQQGLEESVARYEARAAATQMIWDAVEQEQPSGASCALCGRPQEE